MSEVIITCVVSRSFQDKFTKEHYKKGKTHVSSDVERIAFLREKGFLSGEVIQESHKEDDEPFKHVGGGYYELPNGEKVKGKENALERIKELEHEEDPDKQ
ncbi:MAG TPA: hypothetical protein VFC84_05240 [Desulfosporosinus sp.]|nr:hypothetical protein [Desulfosporosinus sp.]